MITWENWRAKPVTVQMARFTGFADGNGYELLGELHDLGVAADRDPVNADRIRMRTRERDDSHAEPGDWIVIGSRGEVYPIHPDVQSDKYERVQP